MSRSQKPGIGLSDSLIKVYLKHQDKQKNNARIKHHEIAPRFVKPRCHDAFHGVAVVVILLMPQTFPDVKAAVIMS
jgi:hypothetical protein